MNDYDWLAWQALQRERERQLSRRTRKLVPEAIRERAGSAGRNAVRRAQQLPGAEQVQEAAGSALQGLSEGVTRAARGSLRQSSITRTYAKAGHPVRDVTDIGALELRAIDELKPNLDNRYMAAGAAVGLGAGFVVAGGQIGAVLGAAGGGAAGAAGGAGVGVAPGAGVGAAPGAATVLGAIAADAAATTLASTRLVFHTAAYYGFDVKRPEERLRALAVLNYATARDQAAKQRAFIELNRLVKMLVRNATWKQLDENVMTQIIRRVFQRLTERMTKQKLAAAVPIAGIVIGAGINMRTLARVDDAADLVYRDQFLRDKYGIPLPAEEQDVTESPPDEEDGDIPLAEIIEEEAASATPDETADNSPDREHPTDPGQTDEN